MKSTSLMFILVILSIGCKQQKKQMTADDLRKDHLVYKQMFFDGMKNESSAPDFLVFNAVDVDFNVEKEFCCERNKFHSDRYLSINNSPDKAFVTVNMTHSQFVEIGAAYYNLNTVDSLFRVYPPTFIDSVYKDYLQGKNFKFLTVLSNKFYFPYIQHIFILNRIPVFRDCESGYFCMRNH